MATPRSWTTSKDPQFAAKERRSWTSTRPAGCAVVVCADELGPVMPRAFPPPPGWSPDGHRVKEWLDYARGPEKTWVYGSLRVRTAPRSP